EDSNEAEQLPSLPASCNKLTFALSYLGSSCLIQSVFDGPHDVAQTAFSRRIFRFAGTATCLDFCGYPVRHSGCSRALNFIPNVTPAKTEAVADREWILGLLCADAHSQVGAREGRCFCVQREINYFAVRRTAKVILRVRHPQREPANEAFDREYVDL